MYELKPIRTNADHARALREVDRLLALDPVDGSADADRLEALTILIDAFERSHPDHRIDDKVDPVAAIEFHLERLGKTTKDLEDILECSRSRVWEIMKRQRPLTLPQIRRLHERLQIPADRLIAPYDVVEQAVRSRKPENDQVVKRTIRSTVKSASQAKSEILASTRSHVTSKSKKSPKSTQGLKSRISTTTSAEPLRSAAKRATRPRARTSRS